jgi:hypothetical protein
LRIPEAGVNATLKTDAEGRASFDLKATTLALWSPQTPKLYKVELASGQDKLTDDIGFRDIRVDGTRILLNGKAIFLQGANMHAEAPYRTGRAYSAEDVKNIFGFLKDLNANFVRLAHYPHDERMERAGQNEYIGWYEMHPEDADKITWNLPQKPILISEFGAEAKQGVHGGKDQRWAEEQQVNVYEHQFVMINKIPQVRGLVPWILMDFRSPTRNIPKLQDGFNRKGLISEDGKKKLAFDLFQTVYKDHSVGKAE